MISYKVSFVVRKTFLRKDCIEANIERDVLLGSLPLHCVARSILIKNTVFKTAVFRTAVSVGCSTSEIAVFKTAVSVGCSTSMQKLR